MGPCHRRRGRVKKNGPCIIQAPSGIRGSRRIPQLHMPVLRRQLLSGRGREPSSGGDVRLPVPPLRLQMEQPCRPSSEMPLLRDDPLGRAGEKVHVLGVRILVGAPRLRSAHPVPVLQDHRMEGRQAVRGEDGRDKGSRRGQEEMGHGEAREGGGMHADRLRDRPGAVHGHGDRVEGHGEEEPRPPRARRKGADTHKRFLKGGTTVWTEGSQRPSWQL